MSEHVEMAEQAKEKLTRMIVEQYGPLLTNQKAAEILKIAPWKLSQISRNELPRSFGRGRGGIKILAQHLAEYVVKNTDFGNTPNPLIPNEG